MVRLSSSGGQRGDKGVAARCRAFLQKSLGLNLDGWMTVQGAEQPRKIPGRCHAFEKEWIEWAPGIGGTRAEKESKVEVDDFVERLLRQKAMEHLGDVRRQWDELIKGGGVRSSTSPLGQGGS